MLVWVFRRTRKRGGAATAGHLVMAADREAENGVVGFK